MLTINFVPTHFLKCASSKVKDHALQSVNDYLYVCMYVCNGLAGISMDLYIVVSVCDAQKSAPCKTSACRTALSLYKHKFTLS